MPDDQGTQTERRRFAARLSFPPGNVALLMVALALLSAAAVAWRRAAAHDPALEVWTFTHIAQNEFDHRLADRETGARITNLGGAMFDRLALAIMTRTDLPSLVEIEQSMVGRYTRGPLEHMPFVDLTDRIEREGWRERIVPARLARYTVQGRVFGIPHDLHPIVLVYRPDVLAELGATPADLATWESFVAVARRFHRPGPLGSDRWRRGIALSTVEGFDFLLLLWQRGGDVFDADGNVTLDAPLAVDTLEFFLQLFEGQRPVAGPKLSNWTEDFAALARGQFLALAVPDWMLAAMQLEAASILADRVRIMPLPAWTPGGRRTSTMGGTALFIPKHAGDVDAAWELARFLYLDPAAAVQRFEQQTVLPPLLAALDDPAFAREYDFFGGQRVGLVLAELAREIPPVNGSPYLSEAFSRLNAVFASVAAGRVTPQAALRSVADQLRATIARDRAAIESVAPTTGAAGS